MHSLQRKVEKPGGNAIFCRGRGRVMRAKRPIVSGGKKNKTKKRGGAPPPPQTNHQAMPGHHGPLEGRSDCMKTVFVIFLSLLFFPFFLKGGEFEEYEDLLAEVKKNYRYAAKMDSNSRIAKEYQEKLRILEEKSLRLQSIIQRLGLGEDFNFTAYSRMVRSAYRERNTDDSKNSNRHKLERPVSYTFPILMMQRDIKELKRMNFSMENGGSYDSRLVPLRGLLEFERLLDYFMTSAKTSSKRSEDSIWRDYFEKRLARMKILASEIGTKLARTNPEIAREYAFPTETNAMISNYFKMATSLSSGKSSGSRKGGMEEDAKNEKEMISRLQDEILFSAKKLREGLLKLKEIGFELDPLSGSSGQQQGKSPALDPMSTDEDLDEEELENEKTEADSGDSDGQNSKELEKLSDKELNEKLLEIRESIYRKNNVMAGIDKNVLRFYLRYLGKTSKKRYEAIRKKYSERGYDSATAQSSAFFELHGMLKSGMIRDSRKDMLRLLRNYEKEKSKIESELERNKFDADWN